MTDRSVRAFGDLDKAAANLEKRLASLRRGAENLADVQDSLNRQVDRGRVQARTLASESDAAASGRGRNVADEASLQRSSTQRVQAARTEEQALANLNRTRESSMRTLQRMTRLGPYPVVQNATEVQLQAQRLSNIAASAQTGISPILTGGGTGAAPSVAAAGAKRDQFLEQHPRIDTRDIARLREEESRLISTYSSGNAVLHRHGALTTEFFQSAARGTVTIRELGYQVGSTIGKFGGWLTAGAALFGVLGALQQVSAGAIDAANGVIDLKRVIQTGVDAPKLRQQFSDLSEHFNVPIKDATEAVYQMGKVFKTQDQAVSAAATALYAVKIGEIDTATATRYLTSIIQGANLSAKDMASLFDQVNNAQNTFGTSIDGTLAGLAKATGSFKNLGGDVQRYLLPLIAVSQKLTGQTGDVAGTAFQRIPNYLAQAKNQSVLRQYGINANGNIDTILQKELNLAGSGKLGRDQIRDIAYATFGHFYGPRIGVPLLNNPQRAEQYIKQLSPEASRGSAERELQTALSGIQEQIKKIGVELQRMGDKLVQSGLLNTLGLAVHELGQMLQFSNTLLDTFNRLPKPLRDGLSLALQLGVALRVAQRFQLGASVLPGGDNRGVRGAIARNLGNEFNPRVQYRGAKEALANEGATFEEDVANQARIGRTASRAAQFAAVEYNASVDRLEQLNLTNATQEEINAAQAEVNANESAYNAALDKQATAKAFQSASQEELALNQKAQASLRQGGVPGVIRAGSAEQAAATARGQAALEGAATGTAVASSNVAAAAEKQAAAEGRAAPARTKLQSALAKVGVGSIVGLLGDLAFAGFIGYQLGQLVAGAINSLGDSLDKANQAAPELATSKADLQSRLETLRHQESGGGALGQTLNDLKGAAFGANPQDLAGQADENYAQILGLQNRQRRRNQYIPFLRPDELEQRIRGLDRVSGNTDQFNARVKRIRQELQKTDLGADEIKKLQDELKQAIDRITAAASTKDFASRLKQIKDPKVLQDLLDAQQSLQEAGKPQGTIRRAEEVYQRIVHVLKGSHNPEDLKKLADAQKSLQQVIQFQIDAIGSSFDLRGSRINQAVDPVGSARNDLAKAQAELRAGRASPGLDKNTMQGLVQAVNEARTALGEAIRTQAEDIYNAQTALAKAQAGDNQVKSARIDIQAAQHALSIARTPAERIQAQADIITARTQLRDQIFQRQFQDIQYQEDIGKITLSQEIQQYRNMLKNATLTRDQRHQLKEQIVSLNKQLESDSGGFELDVGSIKLPTVYEIRRAIAGGATQNGGVTMYNNPNINVNVASSEDVPKVSQAIDASLGGGTAAAMRNAGLM